MAAMAAFDTDASCNQSSRVRPSGVPQWCRVHAVGWVMKVGGGGVSFDHPLFYFRFGGISEEN
jgi:hypothetical protein